MNITIFRHVLLICLLAVELTVVGQRKNEPVLEIAHFSDIHIRTQFNAASRFLTTIDHLKKHYPKVQFVINTGDAVDNPDRSKLHLDSLWSLWQATVTKFAPLPVYSCIGNHDPFLRTEDKDSSYYGKTYVLKQLAIPNRYYSFVKANWMFVALDGNNADGIDKVQKDWLVKLLEDNDGKLNVLLFIHEPIVSPGAAYDGGYVSNWKSLVDLFAAHKEVKCVLSGHTHIYDEAILKEVHYYNGGSVSGYWWEKGPRGDGSYKGSYPGYGLLKLYKNGDSEYSFIKTNLK